MKVMDRNRRRTGAFSLVELMVVIVIMSLLAGLVGNQVIKYIDQAKIAQAKAQIKMFKEAVNSYRVDTDQYPPNDLGLTALLEQPAGVNGWSGPYLQDAVAIPKDPWNNDYYYWLTEEQGKPFIIYSFGKDAQEGGEGINADIYDYELPTDNNANTNPTAQP